MSDLSVPPLSLVPLHDELPLTASMPEAFAWPTPALPAYPAPQADGRPIACGVEGNNGQRMQGRLLSFDPLHGIATVMIPPARTPMPLRFTQFRRLHLLPPLPRLPLDPQRTTPLDLIDRMTQSFRIHWHQGDPTRGDTVTCEQTDQGVYLFEPDGQDGNVLRSFVPRSAYRELEIGGLIGEALVDQQATTPDAVNAALAEQTRLRERKLGEMLVVRKIITPQDLVRAMEEQSRMPMVRIGEALMALGLVSEPQLQEALAAQREDRSVPLGELLVRRGQVSRQDLQGALARKMGYPLVEVGNFEVEVEALNRLPFAVAQRVQALPLIVRGGRLVVALEDPTRRESLDELEFAAQGKVMPVLAGGDLGAAIKRAYERVGGVDAFLPKDGSIDFEPGDANKLLATMEQELGLEPEDSDADSTRAIEQSDNSLVRLINTMILEAQSQGISDIHIECHPGKDKVKVRFRKDGHLRPYLELPHTYRNALIARLKIMCDLDIAERRKPQDGKIVFGRFVPGHKLELRVATIPTQGGVEDAVMRLLASAKPIALDDLNLSPNNLRRVKEAVQRPYGMFLCVGPTGSGKTTTLHSALGSINQPDRKIWTAEDPIEITQPGLRQVQVNPKIDWTFARALRAFLRADPDVIMVGEIRDKETAQTAIEASLTGHLVMSTLHTNSAPETVTRLLDMGMDPFNFADALLAVLAQRLVRRLCTHCRAPRDATPEEVHELLADYQHALRHVRERPSEDQLLADWSARFGRNGRLQTYEARGCPHCDGTGLRGRAGVHELLSVTPQIRHLIQTGTRADDLQAAALCEGMRTLRQDGLEKVLAGITTLAEVRSTTNA